MRVLDVVLVGLLGVPTLTCSPNPSDEGSTSELAGPIPSWCAEVFRAAEAKIVANALLEGTYTHKGDRCYVELPTVDGARQFECGVVIVMLSKRERADAERVASVIGGVVRKHQLTECWGRAYITVHPGDEYSALALADAQPEVLSIDLNYIFPLEVEG